MSVNSTLEERLDRALQASYGALPDELRGYRARYLRLIASFSQLTGRENSFFIVRAPGRVNLIGEHTDYNGYPVLPMAIDRDIVMVVHPTGDRTIELVNENSSFGPRSFEASKTIPPFPQGDWGNYVKAAVQGLIAGGLVEEKSLAGFRGVCGGNVPESSGLSSSSALVVVSALTLLTVNGRSFDRTALAELLARAERYVGMEGGGMDQAISLLGEPNKALKIDFFPLRTRPIDVPQSLAFVVCNSLVRAPKSDTARYAYNRRVVECRLAAAIISKALSNATGREMHTSLLSDLAAQKVGMGEREIDEFARSAIGEKPLSVRDVSYLLDHTVEEVQALYCTMKNGSLLEEPDEGFKVWQRYRHVVTEARRVEQAAEALQQGDVVSFGELMNASHESCRDDYEVSCPELEALVSIARGHGALGARLTGAGFGGCTVNAVRREQLRSFLRGIQTEYYEGYAHRGDRGRFIPFIALGDVLFPCRAAQGAGMLVEI